MFLKAFFFLLYIKLFFINSIYQLKTYKTEIGFYGCIKLPLWGEVSELARFPIAGNVLYINLNVICAIQIISATLLVISITELKNIQPLPLVHM